jgi:drug/metabolite transporter (DMT)-like permease
MQIESRAARLDAMSRRGWALFMAMAVIWGFPYLLIRVAVRQLDPGVLVLARTAPVALLLTPLVVAQRNFSPSLESSNSACRGTSCRPRRNTSPVL